MSKKLSEKSFINLEISYLANVIFVQFRGLAKSQNDEKLMLRSSIPLFIKLASLNKRGIDYLSIRTVCFSISSSEMPFRKNFSRFRLHHQLSE